MYMRISRIMTIDVWWSLHARLRTSRKLFLRESMTSFLTWRHIITFLTTMVTDDFLHIGFSHWYIESLSFTFTRQTPGRILRYQRVFPLTEKDFVVEIFRLNYFELWPSEKISSTWPLTIQNKLSEKFRQRLRTKVEFFWQVEMQLKKIWSKRTLF
jgi:hypothetical protein